MKLKYTLLAAVAMGTLSTAACALEWGGYVRVGPGQKQNSGDGKRCFNGAGLAAPGHGGIGRLGNECQTYGEFALSQTTDVGGVKYKGLLMTNFSSDGSDPDGNNTQVNQIYVEGKGYDIAPGQTFWIGRRFYHRADVHFDDSFFVNMSGSGAGVDEIPVGLGELSLAVFRTGDAVAGPAETPLTRFNIDWEKAGVNPGGTLRVTGVYTKAKGDLGNNGQGISLQHVQVLSAGPTPTSLPTLANTAWLQYARGSAGLDMGNGTATEDTNIKRWRIADSIAMLRGPVTYQALIAYGHEDADGVKRKDFSIGGRVAYALTQNFKLQAELGHDQLKPDVGDNQHVTKFTFAPTLTVGSDYYARPELRFYASYFTYNDAYRIAQGQTKKNKSAVGFQAEIWF
jgi:maltoporin